MPTTEEYIRKIQLEDRSGLIRLWNQIIAKDTPDRDKGKAFEFLILRAFELEGAIVKWPYSVAIYGQVVEQIDGAIHFQDSNISILIECKDYNNNLSIEPIAKLRNQLYEDQPIPLVQFLVPLVLQNPLLFCLSFLLRKQFCYGKKTILSFV